MGFGGFANFDLIFRLLVLGATVLSALTIIETVSATLRIAFDTLATSSIIHRYILS